MDKYAAFLLLAMLAVYVDGQCQSSSWIIFGSKRCNHILHYITGFKLNSSDPHTPSLITMEGATCCPAPYPWNHTLFLVENADWWGIFDNPNSWSHCPTGYFLQGIYHTLGKKLRNIEEGRCTKPANHPTGYKHCYDQDISTCSGRCKCRNGYFVTGMYRGHCEDVKCLEKLRCCKMSSEPEPLDEVFKVKNRIMDKTLRPMSWLASLLGYGWTYGCRSRRPGEDFRKDGTRWDADQSGTCHGDKNNERLGIKFGDWSFAIKNIQFGDPLISDLEAETIDSGHIYNNDPHPLTHTITRNENLVHTVTHTTATSRKFSLELGLEISYSSSALTGGPGGSASFTFGFETSSTTSDSNGKRHSKNFKIISSKDLPPYSAAKWRAIVSKSRTSINYTATIIAKFSTEFQGFLRSGQNYHYQYRHSDSTPTVNYRFGDANVPFYTALKRASEANLLPWMWHDAKSTYSDLKIILNRLTDERLYEFTLTGVFDELTGKQVEVKWSTIESTSGMKRSVPGAHENST